MRLSPHILKLARYGTPNCFVLMQKDTLTALLALSPLPEADDLEPGVVAQVFGTPIVLYTGVPLHKWELVDSKTGEIHHSGSIYASEEN